MPYVTSIWLLLRLQQKGSWPLSYVGERKRRPLVSGQRVNISLNTCCFHRVLAYNCVDRVSTQSQGAMVAINQNQFVGTQPRGPRLVSQSMMGIQRALLAEAMDRSKANLGAATYLGFTTTPPLLRLADERPWSKT